MTSDPDIVMTNSLLEHVRSQHMTWAGPSEGSDLHADDGVWPYSPPSEVARAGIVSALDHLGLVAEMLNEGLDAPPFATQSLLRGGLVGACQALWILACDDPMVRRARALRLAEEEYRYRQAFHETQTKSHDAGRAAHSLPWVAKWRARRDELDAIRSSRPSSTLRPLSFSG